SVSDAGVAALCADTAAVGAYLNVIINLSGIEDAEFSEKIKSEAKKLRDEVKVLVNETIEITEKIIEENQ
ncbi:glutamate formimidoyltransferase, partial [candidate division KSB1 bacterium]